MGAPGTSYWTGSVLVYNTSSGGMSVYLDDETAAVSFGSYLGKCSLSPRPLAKLRRGSHFLVVHLTSGWGHVFRSRRFIWTASALSQRVPVARLWGRGRTAAACRRRCLHSWGKALVKRANQTVKGFWCLSTEPLKKPHFTRREWQKQPLCRDMSAVGGEDVKQDVEHKVNSVYVFLESFV